jgi:hypothetical protein
MSNTATNHTGTLKAFEPVMDGNEVRSWKSQQHNKEYFVFKATFDRDDGTVDVGELNSTSTDPKWTVGHKYTYNRVTQGDQGQYIKFSGLKDLDKPQGGGKGGGRAMPKEMRDRIIRSVALEVAHNALIDLDKTEAIIDFTSLSATANVFVRFVHAFGKDDNDRERFLQNAIRRSVDGLQFRKYITGKVKNDAGELTTEDKVGMTSSPEMVEYAWNCFAYIWAGTKDDGTLYTKEELGYGSN